MSAKLDQSLDEIVNTQRRSARRGRGRRASGATKRSGNTTPAAPVGGVKKSTRATRSTTTRGNIPTGPAAGSGDSKIIVSNLPSDVSESQIKDYFTKAVGPVKKSIITYGPNGVSRGVATVIFTKADGASRAGKLNGLLVDNKPIKVEVVVHASKAPAPEPVKGLGERMSHPKAQPKSAAVTRSSNTDSTRGTRGGRGRGRGGRGTNRGQNAGRAKPKTADELDAEMADYFDAGEANGTANTTTNGGGTQQGVVNTDTGMDDDIMERKTPSVGIRREPGD
ncbi:MAG: hypothetical protein M1816_004165 [Peltula sp. TS41687]|nr:MAG: hypothetical protein M1816_004165 [Peltula sp. TS41687]